MFTVPRGELGKDDKLMLTRTSCIHCKTCDIKAPYQGTSA